MTGEELYEGWIKAAQKCGQVTFDWSVIALNPFVKAKWDGVAAFITMAGPPKDSYSFWQLFNEPAYPSADVSAVMDELVANWYGYFDQTSAPASDSHAKGDVWTFKASGLKAKVLDVDGSKLKLSINGVETDWIEAEELAKNAKKV